MGLTSGLWIGFIFLTTTPRPIWSRTRRLRRACAIGPIVYLPMAAMPLKYTNIYELDTTVAHTGQNSLRIRALSIDNTLPLGNYPLPYIPGENYTLSFYAKGSLAKVLHSRYKDAQDRRVSRHLPLHRTLN